jgi:digeranylgeranylglycerophospholipid reductase
LAAGAGAEIIVKARVTNVIKSDDGYVNGVVFRYSGRDYTCKAKVVIAADGIESQVARWAGIDSTHDLRDVDIAAQYLISKIDIEPDYCDFYIGRKIAPRGYVWVFPKGEDIANVGVGIGGTISGKNGKLAIDYLNEFVKRKFPNGKILAQVVGCVPVGDSLPNMVADGFLIIGDAAHHSDPISGGGIANAMYSGKFAAEAAAEGIRIGDVSAKVLRTYQRRWDKEVGKNFKHICRIRDGVLKFSDDMFDRCAEVLAQMPREKVTMAQIFKTVLKHQPRLLLELRHLILAGWV